MALNSSKLRVRLGDTVQEGQLLYRIHARFEADLQFARQLAEADSGWRIGSAAELPRDFVASA